MALQLPVVTIDDLRTYHAKHFPHAPPPEQFMQGFSKDAEQNGATQDNAIQVTELEEDEDLGYYPDGTKRILTEANIAFLRHSEIHAILRKRRKQRHGSDESEDGELSPQQGESTVPTGDIPAILEKPKQQWTTSSARTKAKNKRNRNKYRAKKKEQERLNRERARHAEKEADDSDEWDPWHQAHGPDVQQDDKLDLDY